MGPRSLCNDCGIKLTKEELEEQRRKILLATPAQSCDFCKSMESKSWRRGPGGPGTLCETCGFEFLKEERRHSLEKSCTTCGATESPKWTCVGLTKDSLVCNACDLRVRRAAKKALEPPPAVRMCAACGHTNSRAWRPGPDGPGTLCDPCHHIWTYHKAKKAAGILSQLAPYPPKASSSNTPLSSTPGPSNHRPCTCCHITKTHRWRPGPEGPGSLCNACHLRWRKAGQPPVVPPSKLPRHVFLATGAGPEYLLRDS